MRAYRADLGTLGASCATFDDLPLEDQEMAVAAWLNAMRDVLAPTTVRRRLATARSFAKWAGYPTFLRNYRAPVPADPESHPLVDGMPGVHAMLAQARPIPGHMALVGLTGYVGMRVASACNVGRENIDAESRMVTFIGKGQKWTRLPLSDDAWAAIAPALSIARPTLVGVGERRARKLITLIAARAGLGHAASHDMRCTFATAALEATGGNIVTVQRLMGHSSVNTTQRYTKIGHDQMRAAVNGAAKVA